MQIRTGSTSLPLKLMLVVFVYSNWFPPYCLFGVLTSYLTSLSAARELCGDEISHVHFTDIGKYTAEFGWLTFLYPFEQNYVRSHSMCHSYMPTAVSNYIFGEKLPCNIVIVSSYLIFFLLYIVSLSDMVVNLSLRFSFSVLSSCHSSTSFWDFLSVWYLS